MQRHRFSIFFLLGFGAMLVAGWVGFPRTLYTSAPQPFAFNHKVHKDKAAQKCTDCHVISSDGNFAGIPALAGCAGCHPEPVGTTAAEKTLVASYVKPGREIPWLSYARQPMNVRFSHAVHVNLAKLSCEKCHGQQGDSIRLANYQEDRISGYSRHASFLTMSECESCHEKQKVDAGCLGCHK